MKKYFILLLLLIFIVIRSDDVFSQAQLKNIRSNAENSANEETSKLMWFMAGFLLNGLGILGGFIYEPNPPASQLVGKDYNYVRVYTVRH